LVDNIDRIMVDRVNRGDRTDDAATAEEAGMAARITAAEAAARLGVKRETLYAYVSRGLIESRTLDGKTSTFDPAEVDALVRTRNRPRAGRLETSIVSSLTHVADQRPLVRGHDLVRLALDGAGFEAVASLLWTRRLEPAPGWHTAAERLESLEAVQKALPDDAPLLDRLRASVVAASAADALRHDVSEAAVVRTAPPLVAAMVDALPARRPGPAAGSVAERLWSRLTERAPTDAWIAALDAALVLLADHDLAASTFAARVAASTRADPYSVVLAGLGALGGPAHGAASAPVHDLLTATVAGRGRAAIGDRLASGDRIPGFGHFQYPDGDPRGAALLELVRAAATDEIGRACDELLDLVRSRTGSEPNVDFALAALSVGAAMPRDAGEAIFAIARTAGWIAHALEEYREAPLRFRPVTRYVGP
jgi:citrate synthase